MKVRYNTEAARAHMKSKLIRRQIDQLEDDLEECRAKAHKALFDDAFIKLMKIAKQADMCQHKISSHWREVSTLREIIDAGTTHIEEPGDFA